MSISGKKTKKTAIMLSNLLVSLEALGLFDFCFFMTPRVLVCVSTVSSSVSTVSASVSTVSASVSKWLISVSKLSISVSEGSLSVQQEFVSGH